jgi:hypothetical protein
MQDIKGFYFERDRLGALVVTYTDKFESGAPFPHVVIPNFLPPDIANATASEFPGPRDINWTVPGSGDAKHIGDRDIEKIATSDEQLFPPLIQHVMHRFNSGIIVSFVKKLTWTNQGIAMKSIFLAMLATLCLMVAGVGNAAKFPETTKTNAASAPDALKVLFVGNSYIYVNNLPGILTSLGNAPGSPHQIETTYVTIGGGFLENLWFESSAQKTIQNTKWDYVVLQEGAGLLANAPAQTARYVRLFDTEIKKSGATTVLFLPWSEQSKLEAQPAMNRSTYEMAKELGAKVAPIGPAWTLAQRLKSDIGLYQSDEMHATPAGSYLAACTIYLTLTEHQKSCPAIEQLIISQDDVTVLNSAAFQAVHNIP